MHDTTEPPDTKEADRLEVARYALAEGHVLRLEEVLARVGAARRFLASGDTQTAEAMLGWAVAYLQAEG